VLFRSSCDRAAPDDPRIAQAAARAAAADVVVVAIGEHREYIGEAMSRADLRPSPGQTALVKALAATGKPVVVLILGGRAQIVEEFREAVGAILMVWHPGSTGSIAAAEILFGDVTPSGRLPFTWPLATGQSPLSYDMPPTARPADAVDHWTNRYIDLPPTPRYPFGYGLTTSKVVYGAPTLDRREVKIGDTVTVRVPITNAGSRPVREVAQAYVRDLFASRARPGRRLAAFRALELAPGETKVVEMAIRPIDLGFHIETGHWVVEAGDFRVFVGADATASASVDFRLTDSLDVPARDEPVLCLDRVMAE
jgi:beta-glucosidase